MCAIVRACVCYPELQKGGPILLSKRVHDESLVFFMAEALSRWFCYALLRMIQLYHSTRSGAISYV